MTAPTEQPAAVLRVVRKDGKAFVAVTTCGCAFRLNVGAEETGNRIMFLLDHADQVNAGERAGCYPPAQVQPE